MIKPCAKCGGQPELARANTAVCFYYCARCEDPEEMAMVRMYRNEARARHAWNRLNTVKGAGG